MSLWKVMELVSDLCFSYGLHVYIHCAAAALHSGSEGLSSPTPISEVNGYVQFFRDEERFFQVCRSEAKRQGQVSKVT